MCRTAPVPSPLNEANMLLNSRTPEQASEEVAQTRVRNCPDSLGEHAQAEELPRVEHLVPVRVAVVQGLIRVVPGLDPDDRIGRQALREKRCGLLLEVPVEAVGGCVLFLSVRQQNHLRVKAVLRRASPCPDSLRDGKGVP